MKATLLQCDPEVLVGQGGPVLIVQQGDITAEKRYRQQAVLALESKWDGYPL